MGVGYGMRVSKGQYGTEWYGDLLLYLTAEMLPVYSRLTVP
jgi:hypothetical protein